MKVFGELTVMFIEGVLTDDDGCECPCVAEADAVLTERSHSVVVGYCCVCPWCDVVGCTVGERSAFRLGWTNC